MAEAGVSHRDPLSRRPRVHKERPCICKRNVPGSMHCSKHVLCSLLSSVKCGINAPAQAAQDQVHCALASTLSRDLARVPLSCANGRDRVIL